MKIAMIAAMANNRVIGKDNQMPWHLPADLQHFKAVTLGKPVIMGRKTFESIGRPLPGRRNLVVSRTIPDDTKGVEWFSSVEQALAAASDNNEVMVIGGGEIYRQCLPLADTLYLTEIELMVDGDAYFPDYQRAADWQLVAEQQHQADGVNPYSYRFITLQRN
ncbi:MULTISPECIES: type 3 dihydrofolate reductase [unclassified Arsukibacterium]|uniref:type 3 dihydrofolate reductase n=1 Tax=unclassified Arsukibacterium TaxID=2635278 RepID=UPI000C662B0C|nr:MULTISPECIES: type 3 dihydrofolate reductase [unclassified Arsukibacterium]MAA95608.1 type 3 dihydrofolate reductase [Rheinheimera sp.]MBM33198.1 type 3 dihydrofolate reductase [Rheinheimera sp.]HAW92581.1 type 3 dihydrofolate reductase [Candidatus Azambacteria bacterium]|tara:strand:- start:22192 stop:22680 length:489 start_codon:yes stop_codon:yes gene_type:complete